MGLVRKCRPSQGRQSEVAREVALFLGLLLLAMCRMAQGARAGVRNEPALVVELRLLATERAGVPVLSRQLLPENAAVDPVPDAAGLRRLLPEGTAADSVPGAAGVRRLPAEVLSDPDFAVLLAVVHVRL